MELAGIWVKITPTASEIPKVRLNEDLWRTEAEKEGKEEKAEKKRGAKKRGKE